MTLMIRFEANDHYLTYYKVITGSWTGTIIMDDDGLRRAKHLPALATDTCYHYWCLCLLQTQSSGKLLACIDLYAPPFLDKDKKSLGKARQCKTTQGTPRQHKRRQGTTRQGKTRQGKGKQDKTREGKARYDKARQDTARESKTRQGKGRQGKTRHDKSRHDKARLPWSF